MYHSSWFPKKCAGQLVLTLWPFSPGGPGVPGNPLAPYDVCTWKPLSVISRDPSWTRNRRLQHLRDACGGEAYCWSGESHLSRISCFASFSLCEEINQIEMNVTETHVRFILSGLMLVKKCFYDMDLESRMWGTGALYCTWVFATPLLMQSASACVLFGNTGTITDFLWKPNPFIAQFSWHCHRREVFYSHALTHERQSMKWIHGKCLDMKA